MNKVIIAIAAVIGLIVISIMASNHQPNHQENYEQESQEQNSQQQNYDQPDEQQMQQVQSQQEHPPHLQGCTSNPNVQFTTAFTDLSTIDALNPIGGLGGGSPARSYIRVKEGMEAPLYNPIDSTLEIIVYADRGGGYGEYGLIFRVSCEVTYMFDHVDRIPDNLKQYAPQTAAPTTQSNGNEIRLKVKAGELIGYTNGTDQARTFDFLVQNNGKKNNFINPSRWQWEQVVYGTCPYDFFVPDLKTQYYEKLGTFTYTGLIKANSCGNPSSDIAGTISGGWFKGDSTDTKGDYFGIARAMDQVDVALKKDGLFGDFRVRDHTPAKYPADVTVGESVCYDGSNYWAFVKLVSSTELSVATGTGSCPSSFPTEQATTWIR
jgi:hypothetical protein